jgi:hypothetical protein
MIAGNLGFNLSGCNHSPFDEKCCISGCLILGAQPRTHREAVSDSANQYRALLGVAEAILPSRDLPASCGIYGASRNTVPKLSAPPS